MTPDMPHRTDGDDWVDCVCGERHWGRFGAAGLILADEKRGIVLQHRAPWSHYGSTWGMPGGARSSDETAIRAALREAEEEAAIPPDALRLGHVWVDDHGPWAYTTVVATAARTIHPHANDPESLEISWVATERVNMLPLLPAFRRLWPRIREQVHRRLILVVDSANVVGSRPDGWWRDRAAATERLRDRLAGIPPLPADLLGLPASLWWPKVILVTEGAASGVTAVTGVDVVSAPMSGDDAIVAAVTAARKSRPDDHVVVVTADRGLRSRVDAAGGRSVGPSVLLSLLDTSS